MANYDARINISANNGPAITAIQEIQNRLDRVNRAAQINFGERVSLGGLERALRTVNQVENAVISLRSTARSLSAPGGGNLGDAFRVAATEANRFFDSLVRGDRQLSNTISGLNEQARAFATLAANIDSADRRFTDYIQGAQAAQDKGLRPLFRQLEALRRLYQESVTGMGTDIQSPQMGATFFERLRNEVPNTVKALQTYRGELERIQSLIESGSVADIGVQQELLRVEQQLLDIERQRLELRNALRGETSPQVQSALGRMEGRGADPLGVSDDQINESLNARAEEYVRQQRELGSLQQVLGAMEGKRYDPLNVTDEQINAALNERAVQYQKQEEELSSLQRVLSAMEGKRYDPLNISDAQINQGLNERASEYQRQQQELSELQRVLAAMEGQKYDPFGITDSQVNAGLDERAAIYQQQSRDMAALQQALGSMEGKRVDWATVFGIQEADVAARRANELEAEWKKLQAAADALAAQAPQTAAALKAFEFKTRAEDANAYTRALLNQQRTLDEYADSASRAARAASGLGYGGELPALRPAGFTSQDVRIKNLLDDEVKSAQIVADLEMELDKIVTFAEIENVQKAYDYEIDKIEQNLRARIKADDAFWDAAKRNIDENDKRTREAERQNALPFLERRFGKRGSAAISEGLIGGAFPLLFGQGLGAAIGGGVGGAAGGFAGGGLGFGLSLIGTALGTVFDTLNTNIKGLASSLKEPTQALEAMKTAGLRVTPELEDTVKRIEALGFAASAQNRVLQELERQLGAGTVAAIKTLNQEQKRLDSEFQRLSASLISTVIPALIQVTSVFADLVGGVKAIFSIQPPDWVKGLAGGYKQATGFDVSDLRLGPQYAPAFRFLRERGERAQRGAAGVEVGQTPEQIRQQQLAPFQTQLDALTSRQSVADLGRNLTDQFRMAAREQEDLDRQRADLVEGYEKAIADIRLGVERRVTQERQANLATENEILAKQGEIRLQQLRNENAVIRESLRGNELGQELFDIVSQYTEQQLQTENEIANRRRTLEAQLQSAAIETEQYKADVAKQVADLNQSTAKQIEQIQLNVLRRQQDAAVSRFQLEKQIALARLQVERVTAEQQRRTLQDTLAAERDPMRRQSLQASISNYDTLLTGAGPDSFAGIERAISAAAAPAAPSFAGFAVGAQVSMAAFDAIIAKGNQLKASLEALAGKLDELVAKGGFQALNSQLNDFADQGAAEAIRTFEELRLRLSGIDENILAFEDIDAGVNALLGSSGVKKSPAAADLSEYIQLQGRLAKLNIELTETYSFFNDALSSSSDTIDSLKEEINALVAGTTEYEKALISLTARGLDPASEQAQLLLANASEIDRLKDKIEVINRIRDAATEFSGSLRGLIEDFVELGSASEALKRFSEELGRKSLGFVLDIAFKPIETAMQKQFIEFGKSLGVDITPEEMKQLREIELIREDIKPIVSELKSIQTVLEKALAPRQEPLNAGTQSPSAPAGFSYPPGTPESQKLYPGLVGPGQQATPAIIEQFKRQQQFTGVGGPDLPVDVNVVGIEVVPYAGGVAPRQAFPLPSTSAEEFSADQKIFSENIDAATASVKNAGISTAKAAETAYQAEAKWTQSLGKAVTGLAGASAGVLAIAGGVQQVKEGGAYGVLTGLAGIFGGIASISSMFGTGGIFAPKPAPGARALGGPVASGNPYIVGEQGPELFVPDSSGIIVSNDDLFDATRNAIAADDAVSGPASADEGADGMSLSSYRSVSAARGGSSGRALRDTREAVKELERAAGSSGANSDEASLFGANKEAIAAITGATANGPLAATRMQIMQQQAAAQRSSEMTRIESIVSKPAKMDISYQSQVINNVEYVTVEQAQRMSSESAKRGRDLAIGALQASVKARKTAGLA